MPEFKVNSQNEYGTKFVLCEQLPKNVTLQVTMTDILKDPIRRFGCFTGRWHRERRLTLNGNWTCLKIVYAYGRKYRVYDSTRCYGTFKTIRQAFDRGCDVLQAMHFGYEVCDERYCDLVSFWYDRNPINDILCIENHN